MTVLPDKTARAAAGVSTFESALIWSFICMKATVAGRAIVRAAPGVTAKPAIPRNVSYDKVFKIEPNASDKTVELSGRLPYIPSEVYKDGGTFAKGIKEIGKNTPDPIVSTFGLATNGYLPLFDPPDYVNNLEKYLVWCAEILECGNPDPNAPSYICSVATEESGIEPQVIVTAKLPIDWYKYINGQGLIVASLPAILSTLVVSTTDGGEIGGS